MMENWIVSIVMGGVAVVTSFAMTKSKVENNDRDIRDLKKDNANIYAKVEAISTIIAEHGIKIEAGATMKEVREEFVTKEMFRQMEKHLDRRFNSIEKGIETILKELKKGGSGGL